MEKLIYEELIKEGFFYFKPSFINNDGNIVEVYVREYKTIHLSFIKVLKQRQGNGTKIMNLLTRIADKYGYTIDLSISSKFGTPKKVLRKFYEKFGFIQSSNDKDKYIRKPK